KNICAPTFNLSVRTKNMSNIVGLQGTISWDISRVKFNSVIYNGAVINITASDLNLSNTANGYLTFSWLDRSLTGKTAADSTRLFTIRFDKNSGATTAFTTPVVF